MKILKKAVQKNFTINTYYYTVDEINKLLTSFNICYFDYSDSINTTAKYLPVSGYEWQHREYRVFADNVKEVKVELDEYGFYTTVVITHEGLKLYVNL